MIFVSRTINFKKSPSHNHKKSEHHGDRSNKYRNSGTKHPRKKIYIGSSGRRKSRSHSRSRSRSISPSRSCSRFRNHSRRRSHNHSRKQPHDQSRSRICSHSRSCSHSHSHSLGRSRSHSRNRFSDHSHREHQHENEDLSSQKQDKPARSPVSLKHSKNRSVSGSPLPKTSSTHYVTMSESDSDSIRTPTDLYKCYICDTMFDDEKRLDTHIDLVHNKDQRDENLKGKNSTKPNPTPSVNVYDDNGIDDNFIF